MKKKTKKNSRKKKYMQSYETSVVAACCSSLALLAGTHACFKARLRHYQGAIKALLGGSMLQLLGSSGRHESLL
jgi:hypothetical protein